MRQSWNVGTNQYVADYFYDETGAPLGFAYSINGGAYQYYFYETNLQGDVIAIYDINGTKVATFNYDAWGCVVYTWVNASLDGEVFLKASLFRYRGYIYDSDTGLYYLQSRYYDPQTGRFINADSAALPTANLSGYTDKNLYAYCDNNPVVRKDDGGMFWGTVFDVVSLGFSIADVMQNPNDVWAWVGLAADAADVLIPFVSGIGEVTKVVSASRRVTNALAESVDTVHDVSKNAKKGWSLGDDITNLTKAGNKPSWSTVRSRYWKNEAFYNSAGYGIDDINRMKMGKPPQIELNGKLYSMELHHIEPRRLGGSDAYTNLIKVSPWAHAEIDPFRHFRL